jgi:acyl-coenzyme A thioesterase PaaI-like protein
MNMPAGWAALSGPLPAAPSMRCCQDVGPSPGFVVFEGSPTQGAYHPLGTLHGGYAATLLDSAMGCAVHSCLKADRPTRRWTSMSPIIVR